ncbi:MAG TPA: hypothetical protein VD731_00035 [Nitrosopumilaceae archaeon]|nr:hypothetical protein [Nitrosopumilaceae archaeon]
MKKAIILAIISIVIIVGIVSILSLNPNFNDELESTSNSTEKEEVIPKGRNLSVELEEKMGFANP